MPLIRLAAFDGALANFGMAKLIFDTDTEALSVLDLKLVKTEKSKVKQVRSSSDDLRRSRENALAAHDWLKDCVTVFVEVPTGGQDAKATRAFGIITGIYASLLREPVEVSPAETKLAAVGTRTASKEEMIEWAVGKFPDAPWLRAKSNGPKWKKGDLLGDNEHLADAVAIAHAGIKLPVFQQMKAMIAAMPRAA
ncbi:hypothetical protein [Paracoccus litorisediminis]|uniref:Holliday junction resolvasome RuvABC endonuclease subunit n=1 Tax=Paracoccus litorisediminis TaxID=2006130 RepID=A0A844HLG9_9RHOB|nr:hypothetical protein [Paracoccus litorisediminis]MTH61113.1 hypothetical protein [Paracoccus litorisediminis]